MIRHVEITSTRLHRKFRRKEITFGGNSKDRIYGKLHCNAGKRMRADIRVFFVSEWEAISEGYRPCGHCMKAAYLIWKLQQKGGSDTKRSI